MLDAKNARKCAEADVQLLANRLSHLRQEETRAQRRIEEANRRSNEIEGVKKRNQEHQRTKQRMFEQMQREIKQACESNSGFVGYYPRLVSTLLSESDDFIDWLICTG